MRNYCISAVALLLLAMLFVASGVAEDAQWFNMNECAMCKPLTENPELMKNMTWENHSISNGVMSIATVKEEYMADYEKARRIMEETGQKLMAGEKVPLCEMCMGIGHLAAKGARMETMETLHGDATLITSNDSTVVAEIHAWAKRTKDEMAKMEAAEKAKMEKK